MRPRLEAEEKLEAVAMTRAATGRMPKGDMEAYFREINERIREGQPQRGARPRTFEELAKVGGTQLIVVEGRK